MKKVTVATGLVLSVIASSAMAQEGMNSLSHRLNAGQFQTDLTIGMIENKYNTKYGADVRDTEAEATTVGLDMTYGVNDMLSLGLSLSLPMSSEVEVNKVDQKTEYKGLSDIGLFADYRYMNSDIKGDFIFGLNISGDRETTTTNGETEVDFKTGNHSINLGTEFTGAMDSFEWGARVGMTYNFENTQVSGSTTTKTDSKADFLLGLTGQYNLMPQMSLYADLDAMMVGKAKNKDNANDGTKAYTQLSAGIGAKYLVSESFMINLGYNTGFGVDKKAIDGSYTDEDAKVSVLHLGASIIF